MSSLLAFLVTLGVLIVVHEWGHYAMARRFGVRVLRFSIGFGPVLWRKQSVHGGSQAASQSEPGTEWVICALPLGGYVRMLDSREDAVTAEHRSQAFDLKPLRQRAAIVFAGPLANLVLAALFYAAVAWMGVQEPKAVMGTPAAGSPAARAGLLSGDWVTALAVDTAGDELEWHDLKSASDLRWWVSRASLEMSDLRLRVQGQGERGERELHLSTRGLGDGASGDPMHWYGLSALYSPPVLSKVMEGGAAHRAGLLAGDLVLKVDGRETTDAAALRAQVRASAGTEAGKAQQWLVQRAVRGGGVETFSLAVTPAQVEENGQQIGRVEALIGVSPEMVTVRYGLMDGLIAGLERTWQGVALTLQTLAKMLVGQHRPGRD
jgi:regulator of sigma E protease